MRRGQLSLFPYLRWPFLRDAGFSSFYTVLPGGLGALLRRGFFLRFNLLFEFAGSASRAARRADLGLRLFLLELLPLGLQLLLLAATQALDGLFARLLKLIHLGHHV